MYVLILTAVLAIAHAEPNCPTDDQQLSTWVTKKLMALAHPYRTTDISSAVESCKLSPQMKTQFYNSCVTPILGFAQNYNAKNHQGGLAIVKGEPDAESRNFKIPSAFLEPELIEAIKRGPDEKNDQWDLALTNLQKKIPNAKIFSFTSAIAMGPHSKTPSVVAIIPGDKEDLYVHGHQGKTGYLSFRIRKKTADDQPIDPPIIDFQVTHSADNTPFPYARCISCHRGGSVAIAPTDGKLNSHTPGMNGEQMKNWWDDFRVKNISQSLLDFSSLGPEIGPEDPPTRTLDFVKSCAKKDIPSLSDAKAEKIMKKMNCVGCHMEEGKLDRLQFPYAPFPFELVTLDNFILKGHMPPGADKGSTSSLSEQERRALLTCLKAEYFGGMSDSEFSQGNKRPGVFLSKFLNACQAPAETRPMKEGEPSETDR